MKLKLFIGAAVATIALAAVGGVALATTASGFAGVTEAKGTFGNLLSFVHTSSPAWTELMATHGATDLYVQQNTWQPGGSTGWHTHPGPSFVVVTQGAITQYEAEGKKCVQHVYTAGTADNSFVDPGDGHVHLLRDETSAVAMTVAVQFTPSGATRRIDVADAPKACGDLK